VILAALEGFSRIYLGQQYPHDVLAGALLSTVVLLAGWALARRPLTHLMTALEATPLRPLLTSAPRNATTAPPTTGYGDAPYNASHENAVLPERDAMTESATIPRPGPQ
jgi:hypothetical protein